MAGAANRPGSSGERVLETRPLYWRGGEARINIQAPHGQARVQITDAGGKPLEGFSFADCMPFADDELGWSPCWKNGRRLSALANRAVRLELEILNGRMYAIGGDFTPMVARQVRRFEEDGLVPEARPGF